jgi:murein DD-endopeptidase MepM/ murein hydrolase activator NlpD
LVTAFLLAGAASGCSSDVTRFDGLFGSKADRLTTSSVPHKANAVNGKLPVPRAEVRNGGNLEDLSGDAALDQPYPGNDNVSYDPISTSTTEMSPARASVTPVRIERRELTTPKVVYKAEIKTEQEVALAQPLPSKKVMAADFEATADPIRTGTVKGVWKVSDSSPRILIESGDTLSAISVKYKVPQAELLRANNLKSGADLKYGKSIVIPVSVKVDVKTKAVPVEQAVKTDKKIPIPEKTPKHEQAILPSTAARDKAKQNDADVAKNSNSDKGKDKKDVADASVYVVVQGDSLARIAKMHKVGIDAIKQANGMTEVSLRIGQKLVIPDADATIKTASIPADTKVKTEKTVKETQESNDKPKGYTPPMAEKSVAEVEKTSDAGAEAPDATGIGKFRWPVRGAVIAGYGQNVDGVRNAGIDISVPEGTAIKAAENGVVIYSGSGLKDLGNTVLVRHDDGTVTVYGNASSLVVKRGEKVTRGQVIANSGMTGGAKRPKVHFEVRQNAVAVNPMTFLQ